MNNAHTQTIPSSLFILFLGVSAVLAIYYLYFIQSSVASVIDRRSYEQQAAHLESELAQIESSYISQIGTITLADAYSRGFNDASKSTRYIVVKGELSGVAMRHGN